MLKKLNEDKGFTLIELTVVVAIIAILVVIAIPIYQNIVEKAAISAHNANVQALTTSAQTAVATLGNPDEAVQWPSGDGATGEHISDNWLQSFPEFPANLPEEAKGNAEGYSVTLGTDGTVVVEPGKYSE